MARRTYEIAFELAGKVGSSFGNLFTSANEKLQQLNRQVSSLKTDIKELEKAQKAGKVSADEYANSYARLTSQLEKAERAQQRMAKTVNLQKKVDDFRGRMRGGLFDAAAMATTVGAPVYAAMQFESAMADVRKVVDFETPQQFKAMQTDILNLSKRIPMAADGIAQIIAAGGQAGIARGELTAFAEDAAKMGVAFDISAEEAGQTMAQWRAAFKMNQSQVKVLADQINYLGNTAGAQANKITDVVRRIGPLGEVGGAAAGQIAALGATMIAAGVSEEVTATGIKNMILAMVAGESATKDQQAAFKALGLDAQKMAAMMQKDAQGAIVQLFQALEKLPKEKQAAVLSELFGKESISAIAPLLTNLERLEDNFAKVGDKTKYAGSMQKEFEERSKTTENSLQLLRNQMNTLAITVGSILLPHITTLAQKLSDAAERVASFTEKHPTLTKVLVLTTTAALGLGVAVTALGYAASLVITPFVRFYTWATKLETRQKAIQLATRAWTAAQWLLNAALRANPIGLIITGVAALAGGLVLLYQRSETARAIMDKLWNGLKDGAAKAINFVIDKINNLIALLNKIKIPDWVPGIGGKGFNIERLNHVSFTSQAGMGNFRALEAVGHAEGGIFNRPHLAWFAEKGPEAAIPLDGSRRALGLWAQAGKALGVGGASGGGDVTVHFTVNINAPGGDVQAIRQGIKAAQEDFRSQFIAMMRQTRRLSYE